MSSETDSDDLTALVRGMKTVTSPMRALLADLHRSLAPLSEGHLAATLPELARADPNWFAICVVDTKGRMYEIGDSQQAFTIQALAHPFMYALALMEEGSERILAHVGVEPVHESFLLSDNAVFPLPNPLVPSGALGLLALLRGTSVTERLEKNLAFFRRLANHEMVSDATMFTAARAAGHRHRALAHLMCDRGMLSEGIEPTLDLFFQQQALLVNCRDLAMMAATLAHHGRNPVSNDEVIEPRYVRDILSVMYTCGMRTMAGMWAYRVGLPAESSSTGAIMLVVPGQLGLAVFSPLLNDQGHSLRGIRVCEAFADHFGLHMLAPPEQRTKLQEALSMRGSAASARSSTP
ncbi:glutaminase [Candidatus Chloroploca sp. Khr17]|uniref:glutaminase n=1 Tax=Candidatus Chloroploca sp. Khr17 TaxID=2496869 RepID=UPI00196A5911|nr:glutaminase [Candidatus Chloroploca sp. Khr17]